MNSVTYYRLQAIQAILIGFSIILAIVVIRVKSKKEKGDENEEGEEDDEIELVNLQEADLKFTNADETHYEQISVSGTWKWKDGDLVYHFIFDEPLVLSPNGRILTNPVDYEISEDDNSVSELQCKEIVEEITAKENGWTEECQLCNLYYLDRGMEAGLCCKKFVFRCRWCKQYGRECTCEVCGEVVTVIEREEFCCTHIVLPGESRCGVCKIKWEKGVFSPEK